MTHGWGSDWEKLFAKCVADADYRRQLLAALDQGIDDTAVGLLDSIGIAGSGAQQRSARLSALKALKGPLAAASNAFGTELPALAAP
jgi:hypothetical protein